jgi:5-methyltetrahydrofolate--homocysteine methyltransferase
MNLSALSEAVIAGNAEQVGELTKKALEENLGVQEIINNGLIAGMNVIGERFKNNEIFIPEVMLSAHAMRTGMELLKPLFASSNIESKGTVLIATVKGDVHDIGKNLVAMMFEGAGFKVIDLGIDVDSSKVITSIKEHTPDIVALSTLLTTTMFALEIGADGYAKDASLAVDKAKELLGLTN